jgi:hypothetical protein
MRSSSAASGGRVTTSRVEFGGDLHDFTNDFMSPPMTLQIPDLENLATPMPSRKPIQARVSEAAALRHGLAVAIGSDPSFSKDIDALTSTLGRGGRGPIFKEFARQAAEAHIDLLRIRRQKAARFQHGPWQSRSKA